LILLVAAAALLPALATGCGGSGDPLRIGVITDCIDQNAPSLIAGAELPLLQRGGKLSGVTPSGGYDGASVVDGASASGRPVELEIECATPVDPSAALAQARWLVQDKHVDAVVGPTVEADPIVARYARTRPGVVFMLASYDQSSTLRLGAPNVFRFELDGAQELAGLAAYAYHHEGWRNVTTVGEKDPPGWVQAAGFDAEFCALGGHVQTLFAPPATDVKGWVRKVSAKADGVFLPSSNQDLAGFITRWARTHDLARQLVLGLVDASQLRLHGVVTVSSVPWAKTRAMDRYTKAFAHWFPHLSDYWGLTYYDEVEPLLEALKKAHGTTSNGEQALQKALARLHYASPEGPIHLDTRRQAIGPTYLARIEGRSYDQFAVVPNVDQTFGGIFGPQSNPPGPHSPKCLKRKPPPWAVRPTR
jgi:branched-chain amino acid transport system substrate-binding protein